MSPTTQCPPAFERLQQPSEKPDWPGPRFLGRTVSDNVQLCQPEPGPKIGLDIYPSIGEDPISLLIALFIDRLGLREMAGDGLV